MTSGTVVVVGGTGAVGRELATLLAGGPHEVVVVGRRGDRAAAVAAGVARRRGGRVSARRADVDDPADRRAAVAGATVVVTCVERSNVEVAGAALDEGAHVVDVSASASVLDGLAGLDGLARWHGRTVALSVGLAPGLTNLLARACVDRLAGAEAVDVTVLVGLGEHHGADAVRWALAGLATRGPAGAAAARVPIPAIGTRTAHPFPFSDQHALRRTLGVPVTTRLCFDSRAVTAAAFGLRPLVRRLPRAAATRALAAVHLGSDRFAVTATATAPGGRRATAAALGRRQSHATAAVAAHVVRRLSAGAVEPGAHHIDQAFDVGPALAAAEAAGLTILRP